MPPTKLVIELLSDTAVSSGTGTPGQVDSEVVHDDWGSPFIPGKTIHGLLRETWLSMRRRFPALEESGLRLLGEEGSHMELAVLRVGDAIMPKEVLQWARYAIGRAEQEHPLQPATLLSTLTDIRAQTAISRQSGATDAHTLRYTRVVLRNTSFVAPLQWLEREPDQDLLRCLALCALGVRHIGLSRSRGLGFVRTTLDGDLVKTRTLAGGGAVAW